MCNKADMYEASFLGSPEDCLNDSLNNFGAAYIYQLKDKSVVVLDPLKIVKYTKQLVAVSREEEK